MPRDTKLAYNETVLNFFLRGKVHSEGYNIAAVNYLVFT